MPSGGARPNGGRRKGSKNKATIERELRAVQELQKKALAAPLRMLSKDQLAELVFTVKTIVARFQAAAMKAGAPGEPGYRPELWRELREWIKTYATVADFAADFESPRIRAVVVAADGTGVGAPYVVRVPAVLENSVAWQAAVGSLDMEPARAASVARPPPIPEPAPAPSPSPAVLTADQEGRVSTAMPAGPVVVRPSGSQEWLDSIAAERRLRLVPR